MRVGRGGNYPPGSFGGQDRLVAEIDLEWPSNHEIVLASNFLKEAFS
jgi:hypothetical protein